MMMTLPEGTRTTPIDGGSSSATSPTLLCNPGHLSRVTETENWRCGSAASGNIQSAIRAISSDMSPTFISIRLSTGLSRAFAIGLSRHFIATCNRACSRRTGPAISIRTTQTTVAAGLTRIFAVAPIRATRSHAARALSASSLSTARNGPGARTRCGNGRRKAVRSSCSSSPSGSQPTQRQAPSGAPRSLVA